MDIAHILIKLNDGTWMPVGEVVLSIGEPWRTDTMQRIVAFFMNVPVLRFYHA